jgi:hypothetical protein
VIDHVTDNYHRGVVLVGDGDRVGPIPARLLVRVGRR